MMDIINHYAGLITSFHMPDAVIRGMFTPSPIPTQLADVWVVNSSSETVPTQLYPEMLRNFQ